jgi:hypothetical protein
MPIGCKIDQTSIKYTDIARPSKNYPKLDFCFENKPSGNPAPNRSQHDLWQRGMTYVAFYFMPGVGHHVKNGECCSGTLFEKFQFSKG